MASPWLAQCRSSLRTAPAPRRTPPAPVRARGERHASTLDALGRYLPVTEKRSLNETQPIWRLSSSSGVRLSPMMSSVLPRDVGTRRRSGRSHRLSDARVDQARFLHAGDDFDRMAQGFARAFQKTLACGAPRGGVCAHDANAIACMSRRRWPTLQAGERPAPQLPCRCARSLRLPRPAAHRVAGR